MLTARGKHGRIHPSFFLVEFREHGSGEEETRRQGDKETRGRGEEEKRGRGEALK